MRARVASEIRETHAKCVRVEISVMCVCVRVCVCLSPLILALQGPNRLISDTNGSSATRARKVCGDFA